MAGLDGYRCRNCDSLFLPPRNRCAKCGLAQKEEVKFTGRGVIRTWTTIYAAPARYKDEAPYTVVLVELEEGVRLVGRLVGNQRAQQGLGIVHSGTDPSRGHMFRLTE